jgi:hypothetical protein
MEFARIARTALAAVVVTTTAAVALLTAVAPATAQSADLKASCTPAGTVLVVDLKGYAKGANTIKVQDGQLVLSSREFDQTYVGSFPRPADVAHAFVVTVRVPGNSRQSFVREVKSAACVSPPPPPAPPVLTVPGSATSVPTPTTTTATPTVSSSAPSSASQSGSSTPPTTNTGIVPLGSKSDLATAGASVAIPLLIGLCLVSALGVVLVGMKRRRRSDLRLNRADNISESD